jgi:hypothetical protein
VEHCAGVNYTLSSVMQNLIPMARSHHDWLGNVQQRKWFVRRVPTLYPRLHNAELMPQRTLGVFMLRDLASYANKVWRMKHGVTIIWDKSYNTRMNVSSMEHVSVETWTETAFWRWNLFARALAGTHYKHRILHFDTEPGTRADAIAVNTRGSRSALYKKALARLNKLEFFGIFERLPDTMELLAFTFCWDLDQSTFKAHHGRKPAVSAALRNITNVRFGIDRLLYEYGKAEFSRRLARMREKKRQGWLCEFARRGCGVLCVE